MKLVLKPLKNVSKFPSRMKSFHKFFVLAVILLGLVFFYYWKNPLSAKVKIDDHEFFVDLAITPKERERGLSGRRAMASDHGMLFLFGSPGIYHFWMKDMQIPLDFLWISKSTIVDIDENVQPPKGEEFPVEIAPSEPIDKVLEINAGIVKNFSIQIGDSVEFLN